MFKKYLSIENHYKNKYIDNFRLNFPNIVNEEFVVREKIDGSNIQIFFTPHEEHKVGRRTAFLEKDDTFQDIWNVLKKYQSEINKLQTFSNNNNSCVRIYGEIFGNNINKRVNYGKDKYILFFDIEINNILLCQKDFEELMTELDINLLCPLIGKFNSLFEVLNTDVDFNSKILNINNNISEGIVIKPYNKKFILNNEIFYIKKKNKHFSEIENKNKNKDINNINNINNNKYNDLINYITDNRIINIFSKYGNIESKSQYGEYIKYIYNDLIDDYQKDNSIIFSDKEKNELIKTYSKNIVLLLHKYL